MRTNNKNAILFIEKFFGHEKYINEEFKKHGYNTYVVFENFYNYNILFRLLLKFSKKLFYYFIRLYYTIHIHRICCNVELIFIMRALMIDETFMQYLKKKYPTARFIMYQWDDIHDEANVLNISKYFDKIATFSIIDSQKYGWSYRPLYYLELSNKHNKVYDFVFIFSLHSRRLEIYNKLIDLCKKNNCTLYVRLFLFFSSYIYRKFIIKDPLFVGLNFSNVNRKPLSIQKTLEIYEKSRIMVDYTYPINAGLTMRTIESIGANMKLITNNVNVLKADFYNPNNIYLYKDTDIDVPESFIKSEYQSVDEKIIEKYSITSWVNDILK